MINVSEIRSCYGCGMCAAVCPKRIIDMRLNADGFYEPKIDEFDKCIKCGLCVECCSYLHDDLSLKAPEVSSYAAWSNEHAVRRKCSSGGVSFEVGRSLINKGYKACGVRYNADEERPEHYVANSVEEWIPSIGSKYIQSYTVDGFRAIDKKGKYFVTGTPCQMDSFRRYLQKFKKEESFILLDCFCHGVPSMNVWRKYIREVEKKTGKITYASWRNKFTGWHDSWAMGIDGEKGGETVDWHDSYNVLIREKKSLHQSRLSQGDSFYRLFLSNSCLGKACYDRCKFKYDKSSADIRIGDFWGKTYEDDEDGVNAAVTFTKKGRDVLSSSNCTLVEHCFEVAAEGQMKTSPKRPLFYKLLRKKLNNPQTSITEVYEAWKRYDFLLRQLRRLCHPVRSVKNLARRLLG